jgi:hypothetical protein
MALDEGPGGCVDPLRGRGANDAWRAGRAKPVYSLRFSISRERRCCE